MIIHYPMTHKIWARVLKLGSLVTASVTVAMTMIPCSKFVLRGLVDYGIYGADPATKKWTVVKTEKRRAVRRCGKKSVKFFRVTYTDKKTNTILTSDFGICEHCVQRFTEKQLFERYSVSHDNVKHGTQKYHIIPYNCTFVRLEEIEPEKAKASNEKSVQAEEEIFRKLISITTIKQFKNLDNDTWDAAFKRFLDYQLLKSVHED